MARSAPDISIVIPTRNRWGRLSTTLAGALRQEEVELEVVVVDDGSTDVTPLRLARISDDRLRVIRHAERRGVSTSRNEAIAAARGAWVAFLDDDDLWAPDKLAKQLAAASEAGATFAYSAAVVVDDALNVRQLAPAPDPSSLGRELIVRNAIPGGCSNLIARTSVVRAVGSFDPQLSVLADWDLWIRLALSGSGAACPEKRLVAYVRHPASMVSVGKNDVIAEVDYLVAKYSDAAEALGVEPDLRGLYRELPRADRRAGRTIPASRMPIAFAHRSLGDAARAVAVLLGRHAERAKAALAPWYPAALPRPEILAPIWLDEYRAKSVVIETETAAAGGREPGRRMARPISQTAKVFPIFLERPLEPLTVEPGYREALLIVISEGQAIGQFLPALDVIPIALQQAEIVARFGERLWQQHLERAVRASVSETPETASMSVSVVVCTRDRTDDLRLCIESLLELTTPAHEILIVDDAPGDDSTKELCREYPVTYVLEPLPGQSRARTAESSTRPESLSRSLTMTASSIRTGSTSSPGSSTTTSRWP